MAQESVHGLLQNFLLGTVILLQKTCLLEGKEIVILITGPEMYKSVKEQKVLNTDLIEEI